jgi:hypothetical protein
VTTALRVWSELPDRVRVEEEMTYGGRPEIKVDVLDGHMWRGWDPVRGARFQPGGYEGLRVVRDVAALLDPAMLALGLDLQAAGEATCAGRSAIRVRGLPRPSLFGDHDRLLMLLFGGTEHELVVDLERGVLLRLQTRFDGVPFRVLEVEQIAFDIEMPTSTWDVEAPDGRPAQPLAPSHAHRISLTDAVARAPCKLFLPARAPAGAELSVMVIPDRDDPARTRAMAFAYSWDGATERVQINESATPPAGLDELGGWQDQARDGQLLRVRDGPADPSGMHLRRYVLLERDGTHIAISGNIELEALIGLATTLQPLDASP